MTKGKLKFSKFEYPTKQMHSNATEKIEATVTFVDVFQHSLIAKVVQYNRKTTRLTIVTV